MEHVTFANKEIRTLYKKMEYPNEVRENTPVYLGVDIGTANVITLAVDENGSPLGAEIERARVTREGMIVDYIGAVQIVQNQIESLSQKLCCELKYAASAYPPGTEIGNRRVTVNILEAAGLDVVTMIDEPTAAARLLQLREGVVVDVGGGTTGVSVLYDGKVIATEDEPTGGFQFDLVIAGNLHIPLEEAEKMKRDASQQKFLFPVVRPVMEKVASIVKKRINKYSASTLYLVGGSCSFEGFRELLEKELSLPAYMPEIPLMVTPFGIALCALDTVSGTII